jgi:predicted porin
MYGGVGGRTNAALVLAFVGLVSGSVVTAVPASAADLGGDCCADLEERVAELEATTARKGNRKVSLEVSGHVNEAVLFWDDGEESNAYVVTNDNARTRFRFKGKAKINSDLEAGYLIEIGIRTANSKRFTQDNDEGNIAATDVGFDIRDSVWFLKSKTYGTGWVGLTSTATDAITEINVTQTKDFSKYSDVEDTGLGLLLRSSNGGLAGNNFSWRRLIGEAGDQPGEGEKRYSGTKYVSPEFGGFSVSAFWGEDDFWDAALRYEGEFGGIKLSAGFGYGEQTDGPETQTECNISVAGDQKCRQWGGSVSAIHEKSGLFVNFGAGEKVDEYLDDTAIGAAGADDGQTFWSVQSGIEKKFFEHGKTTIYGEYYDYEGGASRRSVLGTDALSPLGNTTQVWSTGVQVYGAGIAQGFDKAALTVYLSYRHVEGDLELWNAVDGVQGSPIEDLDLVLSGAIIKF